MEIVQEYKGRDNTVAKAVAAFGFNQPNPEDIIHREDYDSDAEYAVALARMTQTMSTPEYRSAARKVGVKAQVKTEEEERTIQRKEYAEIRKTVTLNDYELEQIDREAKEMAREELATGKISAHQLGATIEQFANHLTKERKNQKAANQQINAMFRKEIRRNTVADE